MDEFLAETAEKGFDNSVWQRICANFRLLLRRLGLDIAYSDDELRELFRRSRNALRMQQQLTATNGKSGARFATRNFPEEKRLEEGRKLRIFEENYLKILDDFAKGILPKDKEFELGETPDALTMLQVPQFPISISGAIFYKAQKKHNLTIDELKQIPAALYNPVMIFDSSDQSTNFNNGMVVLTQIHDSNKKPIVIALNISKTSSFHKINDIASIYGKNNVNQIIDWINDGFLRYSHKNRALAFARFHRLQLPKKATISERSNNTIIDESANVKPIFEKNQENLRFFLKNGENAPVLTVDWQKEGMPKLEDFETETIDEDSPSLYEELEEKRKKALADTLNAEDYNGQRFDDIYDEEWQEMSEDERIKNIEESYDDWQNDIYSEAADNNKYAREAAEKQHSEAVTQWGKEQLLIPARDMARAYAESLGYTIIEEDENSSGTSYYLKVNNGKDDMTLRFSDHAQPYYKWNGDEVTYMRNGKQYTAHTDIEVLIKDFKLDLAPIWEFLEEFAPQGNEDTDNGVRYSINDELADYPIDQRKLNWYKNIIGKKIRLQYNDPNELAQYLIENGVQYDHERDYRTLNAAIQQAKQEVRERSTRIRNSRENAVMAKKDKFYKILSQKYGKDFKINAGTKYDGVEFIGDWMDKHKTEKGRAKAIKAEEAAEVLSKALGEDISADLVVEHFRSLKKSGLLAEYREIRRNKRLLAELAEELAEEDRMELTKDEFLGTKNVDETPEMREYRKKYLKEQAKYRKADMDKFIQDNMPELYTWVLEFLPVGGKIKPTMTFAGEEFTGDWIPREWKTYSRSKPGKKTGLKLLQYERKRENALKHSSGMNSDEIAQAIASKYGGDAAAIEQQIIDLFRDLKRSDLRKMYVDSKIEEKNQLKSEIEEYNAMNAAESFRLLLEQAQMEKVSLIRIQDLAKKYVQKYIPKEMQGTFIQDIVQLNKYSDKPSPAYPDGRREFELAKLLKKIHSFNAKTRIMELLDGTRKRLNSTGIPISNFGDNSNVIAKIRDIVKLQPMDVERVIIDLNERIAQAEIDIENGIKNAPDPNQLRTEKSLYEMFGKLDLKTPEELGYALKELRYLIDQNKESLYFRLKNKLEENRKRNFQVMQEVDGSMSPFIPEKPKDPDKKLNKFLVSNAGLKNLLHLITGKSNKAFEDTELGKLFDELESATLRGASLDRSAMENASKKLYEFFGIKTLKQKKNFFEEINETPEHTGIFINRYISEMTSHFDPETGENIMLQTDKRGFVKGVISVAHARKVVAEYDQNNTSQDTAHSDLGIEFLRQQLNDFEIGVNKVYDLFGNADENEAWKLIIEKTGTKSKEEQNYKSLYPNQYRLKEQTNSLPPPPRQILDTI